MHPTALAFRDAVESHDMEAAFALLHDDCTFNSPVVFRPYEGKPAVQFVLTGAGLVFGDTIRYVDLLEGTTLDPNTTAEEDREDHHLAGLVFRATVDGRDIHGWDFLRIGPDGRIVEFTVMLRPMSAVHTMAEAMQRMLDELAEGGVPEAADPEDAEHATAPTSGG